MMWGKPIINTAPMQVAYNHNFPLQTHDSKPMMVADFHMKGSFALILTHAPVLLLHLLS